MAQHTVINHFDRLGLTLFFAGSLHIALILGVGFTIDPPSLQSTASTLEIMVVHNARKPIEPKDADFLAQTSQEGGGNQEEAIKPKTLPVPEPRQIVTVPTKPVPRPEQKTESKQIPESLQQQPKKTITAVTSPEQLPIVESVPEVVKKLLVKEKKRLNVKQLLSSTNLEIKRLSAELSFKAERFAKRPRRRAINASTKEYKYATYLDAWRRKVERVGNLNYPDEAKRQKLHGSLVLHVAVQADGSVKKNGIRLLHSSGHKQLDDAAIRIVRLAAPYAPFPENIRKETDILDITRTWRFLSNNRLSWKK